VKPRKSHSASMRTLKHLLSILVFSAAIASVAAPAERRKVLIDEDGSGPGGTNQMAMLALLQSPQVEVLGLTIVTGDAWRDEEVQHTLRMLELTGHANVPVVPGAAFPLVRTQEETRAAAALAGGAPWLGAWGGDGSQPPHGPWDIPPLKEGAPKKKPLDEDAAHFLIRQVHAHPGEVTIYSAAPLTNIALALAIDPHFAELTRGIVIMGGSMNPSTEDPEFATSPRHEFNFWFDPEAAHMVLHAAWPRIDVTTVDVSIKAPFTQKIINDIAPSKSPAAQYIAKYSEAGFYLWDELAACSWIDPSIITKERLVYMDVDLSHGPSYGDTLTWSEKTKPATGVREVHAQLDLDLAKFTKMFVDLMSGSVF
jgi:purine nucleosidase